MKNGAVVLHHSARGAASTAGIDDARQIVAGHRRHRFLCRGDIGIGPLYHIGPVVDRKLPLLHRWQWLHRNDEFGLGRFDRRRDNRFCQLCRRNDDCPRRAVMHDMLMVALGIGGVSRHCHATRRHDAQIGNAPFRTVFGNQHDPITLFQPHCDQRFGETGNLSRGFGPADRMPLATRFCPKERRIAALPCAVEKHRHQIGKIVKIVKLLCVHNALLRGCRAVRFPGSPALINASAGARGAQSSFIA